MAAIHFVVEQRDGREAPVCHPEGLPRNATRDMWTHLPERVTCSDCLAVLAGDAGVVNHEPPATDRGE